MPGAAWKWGGMVHSFILVTSKSSQASISIKNQSGDILIQARDLTPSCWGQRLSPAHHSRKAFPHHLQVFLLFWE